VAYIALVYLSLLALLRQQQASLFCRYVFQRLIAAFAQFGCIFILTGGNTAFAGLNGYTICSENWLRSHKKHNSTPPRPTFENFLCLLQPPAMPAVC